jgi:hypothetical protein
LDGKRPVSVWNTCPLISGSGPGGESDVLWQAPILTEYWSACQWFWNTFYGDLQARADN